MKTWKDLTKEDKEKLNMYYNMTLSNKMMYVILTGVMYIGAFVGITLMFLPSIYTFSAGIAVFIVVFFLAFFILKNIETYKKKIKLIFDIDDVAEDVFEISKSDVRKIKKKLVKTK